MVWLTCRGTETPVPAQIEKFLEPYAQEGAASLTERFRQQLQDVLVEEERAVQQRVQNSIGSLLEQIRALEQASQQILERNADSAANLQRASAAAEDAVKSLEARIRDVSEGALGQLPPRIQSSKENAIEPNRQQLPQPADASLRDERETVTDAVRALHDRLRQAVMLPGQGNQHR